MADEKQTKPLSRSLKTMYGIGDFGFTLMSNVDTFYANIFFTNIALLPLAAVSVMTTISAVVDLILSMMYGAWMNKIKPHKWGRYRSWLIMTPWIVPFLYAFEFIKVGDGIVSIIIMTAAMITSRIAWNLPYIANVAMINIAGKTTQDRMALSSIRMVWTALGSVVYSFLGPWAVGLAAQAIGQKNSYAAVAFVFAAFMAFAYFLHFRMFRGYEETGEKEMARLEREAREKQAESKPVQKANALAVVKCNPHLIALIISSITKYAVLFLVSGTAAYYFTYIAQDQNSRLFTIFMFVTNLIGVAASYSARFIVGKMGAKKAVYSSYILMGIVMLIAFIIFNNVGMVIVLMGIMYFALNLSCASEPELFSNCAAFSSERVGYDTTGTVMGLLTVPVKVGIVLRGILINAALAIGGFSASVDPAAATESVKRGICVGFMLMPAIFVLAGACILIFGYRLKPQQ
ncbi:MAG: MFS transporter [Eubacterium sp.]|nr:MFS transporter [Eubacterium sp.]